MGQIKNKVKSNQTETETDTYNTYNVKNMHSRRTLADPTRLDRLKLVFLGRKRQCAGC